MKELLTVFITKPQGWSALIVVLIAIKNDFELLFVE